MAEVNRSNAKKFLVEKTGLRAQPEAVIEMQKRISQFAFDLADKIKVIVDGKNKKTIAVEDFNDLQ